MEKQQLPEHVYNFMIVSGKSAFSLLYKLMTNERMFFPILFTKGHSLDLSVKTQKLLKSLQQMSLSIGVIWQNSHFMFVKKVVLLSCFASFTFTGNQFWDAKVELHPFSFSLSLSCFFSSSCSFYFILLFFSSQPPFLFLLC